MDYDTTIADDRIERMVATIEPTWNVRSATAAENGHHAVYRLELDADGGPRECVLKATPPGKPPACDDEARTLAAVGTHTAVPVPSVYGLVDDHDRYPAPYFLAEVVPGADYDRTDLPDLGGDAATRHPTAPGVDVESIARSSGRHLAALHAFDAVDAYGHVEVRRSGTLAGDPPPGDPGRFRVVDGADDWPAFLDAMVREAVESLEPTRFGDLAPAVRRELGERAGPVEDRSDPVLARIDHSLDNLRVDPATGAVTGLLDWEFCMATVPAYDLALVEHSLAGGAWRAVPGVPDHRDRIRPALLAGYREAGRDPSTAVDPGAVERALERFRTARDCYALLAETHGMVHFDDWFDAVDATDRRRERAAERLREAVRRECRP